MFSVVGALAVNVSDGGVVSCRRCTTGLHYHDARQETGEKRVFILRYRDTFQARPNFGLVCNPDPCYSRPSSGLTPTRYTFVHMALKCDFPCVDKQGNNLLQQPTHVHLVECS